MSLTLNSNISEISGVGPGYQKKLAKLGVNTVRDLIFNFPRRWDDYSKITPISEVKIGKQVSVRGRVFEIKTKKTRRGATLTELILTDETGSILATWFNQRFLENSIKPGDEIYLAGKFEWNYGQASLSSPAWEKVDGSKQNDLVHVGRIIPVYRETEGLSSKWLRSKIMPIIKLVYSINDHLPQGLKTKHDLIDLSAAVRAMHFPSDMDDLARAKYRLKFDDLFCLFCAVLTNKIENEKNRAVAIEYGEEVGKRFVSSLPFDLTDSQRKSAWEILKDISRPIPMNRLLEGDVGSGKTVVATMAALMAAKRGYQTAFLVPTEILANQHYENIKKLLSGFEVGIEILTGSLKGELKKSTLKKIEEGEAQIIVGTHSLLNELVKFWTLGLVIVDEQHRFGVKQRLALKKANGGAGTMPHFLSMSATPIPRTLAISVFGDLDISILDEVPKGRKKVLTHLVSPEKRDDGYKFIDQKISEGRQVFVICPLVSDSDKMGVKSAEAEAKRLSGSVFSHRKVGLLHGRLKPDEKKSVMNKFQKGEIDILVSTSVIEVGVDVPNATIMMIESAERFGLAQLHQFRGRVGRGKHQSFCFLFSESWGDETEKRLNALLASENGFELSEKDLEIRGPGELLGVKQHGKIDDILSSVISDPGFIVKVKKAAEDFLAKEDMDQYPALAEKVSNFESVAKME